MWTYSFLKNHYCPLSPRPEWISRMGLPIFQSNWYFNLKHWHVLYVVILIVSDNKVITYQVYPGQNGSLYFINTNIISHTCKNNQLIIKYYMWYVIIFSINLFVNMSKSLLVKNNNCECENRILLGQEPIILTHSSNYTKSN